LDAYLTDEGASALERAPPMLTSAAVVSAAPRAPQSDSSRVVVTDMHVPFLSVLALVTKVAIAMLLVGLVLGFGYMVLLAGYGMRP
jgi:hypothetical protein